MPGAAPYAASASIVPSRTSALAAVSSSPTPPNTVMANRMWTRIRDTLSS
ncbi:hypothetical protein [Streptomyces sp. NPDC002913]